MVTVECFGSGTAFASPLTAIPAAASTCANSKGNASHDVKADKAVERALVETKFPELVIILSSSRKFWQLNNNGQVDI